MKLGIFLVLLACCLYLATARPNDIVSDDSEEESQPATAEHSENEEFDDENSQSESEFEIDNDSNDDWLGDVIDTEHAVNDEIDRIGKKPLHELAELLNNDYNVSKSKMIESLEQLQDLFEITRLKKSTEMYKQICDYVNNTKLRNQSITYYYKYTYEVDEIFKVCRHEEVSRYEPYERNFNRQLLFHGTKPQNLVSILKNGLKIAPPEAEHTDAGWFGRGIYFSDSVSCSAPYCRSDQRYDLVFLCEVALGVLDIRNKRDNSKLIDHCESVQALGRYYPHSLHVQPDGLKIPNGVLFRRNEKMGTYFNEFVISDVARVKIRYLVKLNRIDT